jgi:uridylate kinase
MNKNTTVISLGGSLVVPKEIEIGFLKNFKTLILKLIREGYGFVLVVGGGSTARKYQKAASQISNVKKEDKDWVGIQSTILNAQLIKTIFGKAAYPRILENPNEEIKSNCKLYIAAGWKPGFSTDYDAVLLAKRFKAKAVINASDIDYVYDKDIDKDKNAKPQKELTWPEYKKIIGGKWTPGMNVPFDPVASKIAQKLKIQVIVANGSNLKNLEKIIRGEKFKGTVLGK